jgi:hypothetical protein
MSAVDVELWVEQLLPHPHPVGRLAVVFACCTYAEIPRLDEFVELLEREAAWWTPTVVLKPAEVLDEVATDISARLRRVVETLQAA